ncbi:MAG: hypothetical protein A2901_00420 [Elusimicrobia bacterium RIFCSPLOWO2_01_FULL_54_10]|nr:MAG: hypothetical protein A2901_00420 [Elusimicrobia bacterium RIFCSPLOWO2_01_FULL_54_10]
MNFKDIFFKKIATLRNLFYLGNFLALGLFLLVLYQDHFREWKPYQRKYKEKQVEELKNRIAAGDEKVKEALSEELNSVKKRAPEIKQILAGDLHRVDRCITCHQGMDSLANPALINDFADHPFAAPKNAIHAAHPFEKYGCTVCHDGQGLATTFNDAAHMPTSPEQKADWKKKHDWEVIEYWEEPMKAGPMIYASCSKCHEAHPNVPGMKIVKEGKQIFFDNGCIGCHQVNGDGGPISVDLAVETAIKPVTRIDFGPAVMAGLITKRERTLENWIRLHFSTNPTVIVPGDPQGHLSADPKNPQPVPPSAMPYFGFNDRETEALTAYMMSLKEEKEIPYSYRVTALKEAEPKIDNPVKHGRYVFQKYGCVSCHGKDAEAGIPVFNRQGLRVPDLVKTAGTFTREELVKKIQIGVNPEEKEDPAGPTPPLYMPPFKDKIKGREMENLVTYLLSIAEKQEDW